MSERPERHNIVCPACLQVTNRLPQHLDTCKKHGASGRGKEEVVTEARNRARDLVERSVVTTHELVAIVENPVGIRRFNLLREFLIERGMYIRDIGGTSSLTTTAHQEAPQQQQQQQQVPCAAPIQARHIRFESTSSSVSTGEQDDHQDDGDIALKASLAKAVRPYIFDPSENITYSSKQSNFRVQQRGLYKRVTTDASILLRYDHYQKKQHRGKMISEEHLEYVARALGHIYDKFGLNLDRLKSDALVAQDLLYTRASSFVNSMAACKLSGETMRACINTFNNFLEWLLLYGNITDEKDLSKLKRIRNALIKDRKGINQQIKEELRERKLKQYRKKPDITLAQIAAIFSEPSVIEKLQNALKKLESAEGKPPMNEYLFLQRYLLAKMQLVFIQRPEVGENLHVSDWKYRWLVRDPKSGKRRIAIGLSRHKTKKTKGILQFYLTKEEEKLFKAYFKIRKALSPIKGDARACEEPFFITYLTKESITNAGASCKRFLEQIGHNQDEAKITSTIARHLAEMQSKRKNTPEDQQGLADFMGHSLIVARTNYTDPTPYDGLDAVSTLERMIEGGPSFEANLVEGDGRKRKRKRGDDDEEEVHDEETEPKKKKAKKLKKKKADDEFADCQVEPNFEANPVETGRKALKRKCKQGDQEEEEPKKDDNEFADCDVEPKMARYLVDTYLQDLDAEPTVDTLLKDQHVVGLVGQFRRETARQYYAFLRHQQDKRRVKEIVKQLKDENLLPSEEKKMKEPHVKAKLETKCHSIMGSQNWRNLNYEIRIVPEINRAIRALAKKKRV